MSKHSKLGIVALVSIAVIVFAIVIIERKGSPVIRYGISPFQDTAMPKVAEGLDLYRKNGLDVKLITIPWEDVVPALASGNRSVDVAIGSINTFLPRAENVDVKGGGDVVMYFPLYVFKGANLMIHGNSDIKPLSTFLAKYPGDRDRAIKATMLQLKGRTIAVPSGTPYEQMLLAGLRMAGMNPKTDVDIRDVKLENALYAFQNDNVDVIGAGVTQRTEAMRSGAKVFMDMETLGFAEIIGIMTTRKYADEHPDELRKLVHIWFESVDTLFGDVDRYSAYVLKYLDENSSTKYTLAEYKRALGFQEFPRSVGAARTLMLDPDGTFYWRRTWNIVNEYLIQQHKITEPIPDRYFMGDEALKSFNELNK